MANLAYQHILNSLNEELKNNNLVILDYGCGDGSFAKLLPLKKIKKYLGLEINENSLAKARQTFILKRNLHFNFIDSKKLVKLRPNQSNIIISIGVLQYLTPKQIDNLLKSASLNLVKGGVFILSCTSDHFIYKFLNIYQFFLPHNYINRRKLLKIFEKYNFKIIHSEEKGLFLTPLFSNVLVFFFDAMDKILFKTQGELGPIGNKARELFEPIIKLEYKLPIDFGYTFFVKVKKII